MGKLRSEKNVIWDVQEAGKFATALNTSASNQGDWTTNAEISANKQTCLELNKGWLLKRHIPDKLCQPRNGAPWATNISTYVLVKLRPD